MIVYRICQTYPPNHDPIDGQGSFIRGGRWNPKGVYAVYTASSLALARSELSRHVNLDSIPDDFRVYEIELPGEYSVSIGPLPEGWKSDSDWKKTQGIGLELLGNIEVLSLRVPSICDDHSFNYILNPQSKYYNQVKIVRDYPFIP